MATTPPTTAAPGSNELANQYVGKGMTTQQMIDAGLTPTQASTISSGFTGSFGGGPTDPNSAQSYRTANNLTVDANGYVSSNNTDIQSNTANNVNNPTLPANTTLTPTLQTVQQDELLNANNYTLGASPTSVAPQVQGQAIQGAAPINAATVDANAVTGGVQAQTISPTYTTAVPDGVAAQGVVNPSATVQGQLATLYASTTDGTVPPWASAAYNAAQGQMAARGLGASSISAAAITQAYMQSALPIAAQDASTYFQMDMKNLDNSQQMALQNLQNHQQDMLTDTSIANATAQFNATSAMQTQQFVASMISQISGQNADRINAVNQFNTTQANSIAAQNAGFAQDADKFNATNQMNMDEFNANMQNSRDQFNAQMGFAVDQSNVLWQRSVSTADTAAINAANQVNVQNMFNMSQTAQNQLWQQMADSASWAFQASMTQEEQAYNMAVAAGNTDLINNTTDNTNMVQMVTASAPYILAGVS